MIHMDMQLTEKHRTYFSWKVSLPEALLTSKEIGMQLGTVTTTR